MAITAHGLNVVITGYTAEVLINDVPLMRASIDKPRQATVHATPWIVDGLNELRMNIERAGPQLVKPAPEPVPGGFDSPWRASATVIEGELGEVPSPENSRYLAAIDMLPPDGHDWAPPLTVTRHFSVSGRPRWAWQDARPINPDAPADRARVLSFVREVHADFVAKRIDAILDHMTPLFADSAHLGMTPAESRASIEQSFWELARLDDYDVAPYEENDVVLRPVAHGRVILVFRKDGTPLLQSGKRSSAEWTVPLFIAFTKEGLKIVNIG